MDNRPETMDEFTRRAAGLSTERLIDNVRQAAAVLPYPSLGRAALLEAATRMEALYFNPENASLSPSAVVSAFAHRSTYGIRYCRGHFHVVSPGGDDLCIEGVHSYPTASEASAVAETLNAAAPEEGRASSDLTHSAEEGR